MLLYRAPAAAAKATSSTSAITPKRYLAAQVLVPDSPPCRATLLHKPSALPPATAYTLLGSRQPQVLRQAALAGLWTMRLLRRSVAALDRSNASGIEDSLLVSMHVLLTICLRQCKRG